MKYLFIVLSILCAASLATFIAIWPEQDESTAEPVVTINGYSLSREAIQSYREKEPHHGDEDDFLNDIITKQLLLAEAQRLNIDKESEFRKALKTFYEHSLIKILMERVNDKISVEISDDEIDKYLTSFGRTFTFYTLHLGSSKEVTSDFVKSEGVRHESAFQDISGPLQQTLAAMRPGDISHAFETGNEKLAVFLESIEGEPGEVTNPGSRSMIERVLIDAKTQLEVNKWIEDLREKASITYHNK